jgi:hypothetical protein
MTRHFLPLILLSHACGLATAGDDNALAKAVTLYASFDEQVAADVGGGVLTPSTRYNHPTEKGKYIVEPGFSAKAFRIAKGMGISGGALEAVDVLPDNGRIFFPAKRNIAFKKGGWGGAVSVWIKTDPDRLLKTTFCDPVQITQKGANNGGIWFDFNSAKPRDLRMGTFPAIPDGQKGIGEDDPKAPMVRVPGVGFKQTDWHHVVLSWDGFDAGAAAKSAAALWIDGKRIGTINQPIAMDWDIDQTGIYIAVNYIGLLDEFAIFNRPLTAAEVGRLHQNAGALAPLAARRKTDGK